MPEIPHETHLFIKGVLVFILSFAFSSSPWHFCMCCTKGVSYGI